MSSNSVQALRFSVLTLVKQSSHVYMWTFTFKEALPPRVASKAWKLFQKKLVYQYPDLGGVRVFELHPGWRQDGEERSHGIHVHMITSMYLDVNKIRGLLNVEIGRIHVVEAKDLSDPGKLAGYLSKYVSKAFLDRDNCMKRMRLWGVFGTLKPSYTKVKDVQRETAFSVFVKRIRELYTAGYDVFTSVLGLTAKHNELFELLAERDSCKLTKRKNAILFRFLHEVRAVFETMTPAMSYRLDAYFKTPSLQFFY